MPVLREWWKECAGAQSITSTIYSKDHIPALLDAVVRRDASTFDSKPKRLDFEFPTSTLDDIYYADNDDTNYDERPRYDVVLARPLAVQAKANANAKA